MGPEGSGGGGGGGEYCGRGRGSSPGGFAWVLGRGDHFLLVLRYFLTLRIFPGESSPWGGGISLGEGGRSWILDPVFQLLGMLCEVGLGMTKIGRGNTSWGGRGLRGSNSGGRV